MFIRYRTLGFILKKKDFRESDRLFTIYTKDFGKLELLARGERKIKSKLRGGLELFYLSEIEFIQGKTHKTLTDAILIDNFENLRKSLKRLAISYKIAEVIDNLVKGQESDENIWNLLKETFERLNTLHFKSSFLPLIYFYFLWNFLSLLGYRAEISNCVSCQKRLIPEKLYFNPKEGGVICQSCFEKIKSGQKIRPEIIKILRIILKRDWPILSRLKIDKEGLEELKSISESYLNYVLKEL